MSEDHPAAAALQNPACPPIIAGLDEYLQDAAAYAGYQAQLSRSGERLDTLRSCCQWGYRLYGALTDDDPAEPTKPARLDSAYPETGCAPLFTAYREHWQEQYRQRYAAYWQERFSGTITELELCCALTDLEQPYDPDPYLDNAQTLGDFRETLRFDPSTIASGLGIGPDPPERAEPAASTEDAAWGWDTPVRYFEQLPLPDLSALQVSLGALLILSALSGLIGVPDDRSRVGSVLLSVILTLIIWGALILWFGSLLVPFLVALALLVLRTYIRFRMMDL